MPRKPDDPNKVRLAEATQAANGMMSNFPGVGLGSGAGAKPPNPYSGVAPPPTPQGPINVSAWRDSYNPPAAPTTAPANGFNPRPVNPDANRRGSKSGGGLGGSPTAQAAAPAGGYGAYFGGVDGQQGPNPTGALQRQPGVAGPNSAAWIDANGVAQYRTRDDLAARARQMSGLGGQGGFGGPMGQGGPGGQFGQLQQNPWASALQDYMSGNVQAPGYAMFNNLVTRMQNEKDPAVQMALSGIIRQAAIGAFGNNEIEAQKNQLGYLSDMGQNNAAMYGHNLSYLGDVDRNNAQRYGYDVGLQEAQMNDATTRRGQDFEQSRNAMTIGQQNYELQQRMIAERQRLQAEQARAAAEGLFATSQYDADNAGVYTNQALGMLGLGRGGGAPNSFRRQ